MGGTRLQLAPRLRGGQGLAGTRMRSGSCCSAPLWELHKPNCASLHMTEHPATGQTTACLASLPAAAAAPLGHRQPSERLPSQQLRRHARALPTHRPQPTGAVAAR